MSIFARKDRDPEARQDDPDRRDDREAVRADMPPDEQVVDRGDRAGDHRAHDAPSGGQHHDVLQTDEYRDERDRADEGRSAGGERPDGGDRPAGGEVADSADRAGDHRGEYSGADDMSRGTAGEGAGLSGRQETVGHDDAREGHDTVGEGHDAAREGHGGTTPEAGGAAGDPSASGGTTAAERASSAGGDGQPERLVPRERADAYSARWDSVKSTFVDEPRAAVAQADALVGELLDEMHRLFGEQRSRLEEGLDADTTTTEDLRLALRRYRSFFDRLVSF
jgi:hypothetical protein